MITDINERIIMKQGRSWQVYMLKDLGEEKLLWRHEDRQNALDAQRWFARAVEWFVLSSMTEASDLPDVSSFIRVRRTPKRFGVYMLDRTSDEKVMWYADTHDAATSHANWFRDAVKEHVRANATGSEVCDVAPALDYGDQVAESKRIPVDSHQTRQPPVEALTSTRAPSTLYDSTGKLRILTAQHLQKLPKQNYVYVLCEPGNGPLFKPFYVGLGQGSRVFHHEEESKDPEKQSAKVEMIRGIWNGGGEIVRFIDGCFDYEPWNEEQQLIARFGLRVKGTGMLTNMNEYDESFVVDGAELRKYKNIGDKLPPDFIHRRTRLQSGPRRPKRTTSVYGKIVGVLDANPGITGEELVERLLEVDFSNNKSVYTQADRVSRPWLLGYIDAGVEKEKYIQRYGD